MDVALRPQIDTGTLLAQHRDAAAAASDGAPINYRVTSGAGTPKAVVVMVTGTHGTPETFDLMANELSRSRITSYSVGSRTIAPNAAQHADDLERMVQLAIAEHPRTPIAVMGTSLGAMVALDWRARLNTGKLPVLAMNPVLMEKILPFSDRAKIAAGLFSKRFADMRVNTPMTLGVPLTTNPLSLEFAPPHPERLTVRAGLYGDVAKMLGKTALHAREARGPLTIAIAGADKVAVNGATSLFAHLLRGDPKTVMTIAGEAHDLSQAANNPQFVRAVRDFVLKFARVP